MVVLGPGPDLLHVVGLTAVDRDGVLVVTDVRSSHCHRPPDKLLNINLMMRSQQEDTVTLLWVSFSLSWVEAQRPVRKTSSRLMKGVVRAQ